MPKSLSKAAKRKNISEDDLNIKNCRFLPLDVLDRVCEQFRERKQNPTDKCKVSLLKLQRNALDNKPNHIARITRREQFNDAISKAVCTQNWDQLKYILLESPIWEHYNSSQLSIHTIDNYLKAVTILLTYHHSAKSQCLMDDLLHMGLSVRSDEEKAAFKKLLATFPDKMVNRNSYTKAKGR